YPRDQLAGGVRDHARRLVVEQQVLAARRAAGRGADDLLRDRDGDERGGGAAHRRQRDALGRGGAPGDGYPPHLERGAAGARLLVPVHLGALDPAAVPLRPAHGPGMESDAAAGARVSHRDRYGDLVPARAARLGLRRALRAGAGGGERGARGTVVLRARPRPPGERVGRAGACLMAVLVKVMKRPVKETSYLRATLKGMALTFRHLFRPDVTMH